MTPEDWRSPARYENLRSLDGPGFAWEYLRRNHAFIAQRTRLEHADRRGKLDSDAAEAFARRWGVRFHECCQQLDSQPRPVDGACAPHGHRNHRSSRKSRDT